MIKLHNFHHHRSLIDRSILHRCSNFDFRLDMDRFQRSIHDDSTLENLVNLKFLRGFNEKYSPINLPNVQEFIVGERPLPNADA